MLERIIDWSIANRVLVVVASALIALWGGYAVYNIPLDAIPDLSDVQVIIFTEFPGQGPQVVEDQVTYQITTQMLAVPHAKVVRGYSFFGVSFVYLLFEDGTDLYWARSRVLEYLNYVQARLPVGATPSLGPDATGVGWAFMYALRSQEHDLAELRSLQDWFLKYELMGVEGVAEVASVGGFVKQYQVTLDPNRMRAYGIPISQIRRAISRSNSAVGGRVLEMAETEFMIRGQGYLRNLEDLRDVVLRADPRGVPVLLRDLAQVQIGPEMRRGLAELDGLGETVGGIVVVRHGVNALEVIDRVKSKLEELKQGLPSGVEIVPVYDRSGLIRRSVRTLIEKLLEEGLAVALVCLLFLLHFRSSLVAILTLPLAVLMGFVVMHYQGINSNIMSLGGIAIAIGAMVDAAIIMVENAHRHLEKAPAGEDRWHTIARAAKEVGPTLFFALLVITVSFIPVFSLGEQEGRLFKPLAYTKTYAMAASSLLAITLVPVLMGLWVRGKIRAEQANPLGRLMRRIYQPLLNYLLRGSWAVLLLAALLVLSIAYPYSRLGTEFMPELWEGDLLYMPTTLPGISISKARDVLQRTDQIIRSFPEVERVFGKVGRADTATDPAPLSMIETTVQLKPPEQWRSGMTRQQLVREMNEAIQFPGLTNTWTMPIKTRIDMLSTGIKTPVGIKLSGPDLNVLEELGREVEYLLRNVPGTLSVYAERVTGGNFLDFNIDRKALARYGLTISDVQEVIATAVGGTKVTTFVEGLERYPVNLRYGRDFRDNPEKLGEILIATPGGAQIPLSYVTELEFRKGPPAIKTENSRPNAWIYVDLADVDLGTYVRTGQRILAEQLTVPAGYNVNWSGQWEYLERANQKLMFVVPITLLLIFAIIYLNTHSIAETAIVLLAVPFSLVGAFWLLYWLDYDMSVAVWVGIIALAGLDAETGVVMLLYLNLAYRERMQGLGIRNRGDLIEAIEDGAAHRLRPKVMTASVILAGLLPILWSTGSGADVMKRVATPMVGGVTTSVLLELCVYPVIFYLWKGWRLKHAD